MNYKQFIAIFILIGTIVIVILCIRAIANSKKKSRKIIEELTPLVENADTLEKVQEVWDLLYEKCVSKDGKYCNIDIAYKNDFYRLNTICATKMKILNKLNIMKKFESKYGLGDIVTLTIGNNKIRWCSVTAVKFENNSIKYDILCEGHKVYDVSEYQIESIEEQPTRAIAGEYVKQQLTTSDGVVIYEGDEYFVVRNGEIIWTVLDWQSEYNVPSFSSKDEAEKYLKMSIKAKH